mmetsp:Transcript_95031/g.306041  ORF Transcript_95031/g.306041 Transcript_95031/m.306041 type:complete len:214 (+) Transcript_95031:133-774(+)
MAVLPESAAAGTTCRNCGKEEGQESSSLKRCGLCKAVRYCSVLCQKSDIQRHRREDRCGATASPIVASSSGASPSAASTATAAAPAVTRPVAAAPSEGSRTGPKCMRCRKPAGEAKEGHGFADIVQRSIFASEPCLHGPYCSGCTASIRRQTLPFCHGCGALVARMEAAGEAKPACEVVAAAAPAVGSSTGLLDKDELTPQEEEDKENLERLD